MNADLMEKIVSLCKRRGFIFQSSEIYGGLESTWDYGPLGVELKRNVKEAWWRSVVYERDDMEGIDAAILMHPSVWMASGHVESFADLLVDCRGCKKRFRLDQLIPTQKSPGREPRPLDQGAPQEKKCPECGGALTEPRRFNLMFKTSVGSVEEQGSAIYLRPETAQGIFVNFDNVLTTSRRKLPFGIAQAGKAFRNEITTGNFTFRSREFEQMEIEYFVKPGADEEWHKKWIDERLNWYLRFGLREEHLRLRPHGKDEIAHYAKACTDIEYLFPMGWSELEGIANRTDFDLKQHSRLSGKDLSYFDEEAKERFVPYVIEPSGGVDRAVLAFLIDSYREEIVKQEKRVVLGLHKALAPVKAAILPLLKNRGEIVAMCKTITAELSRLFKVKYDDTASIGRLYRRQDEIGTPFCITVDVDSLSDRKATVRDRDTMQQDRVSVDKLKEYLTEKMIG